MPRYFFDARNGSADHDTVGTDLKDHSAARKHGIVFAGDVMHSEPNVLWDGQDFVIEVSDEHRALLFTITAFATNAPAGGDTK